MPAQLFLVDVAPRSADLASGSADLLEGQLPLFVLPPVGKPVIVRSGGMASSDIGEAGESMFEGSCRAWGLQFYKAGRGQIGPDYYVNGWRVQVKASASIQRDGRIWFQAGSNKRFIDYKETVDVFAFVYVGLESDHYGRSLLMSADNLFQRCRARHARIRPLELPRTPDLRSLVQAQE